MYQFQVRKLDLRLSVSSCNLYYMNKITRVVTALAVSLTMLTGCSIAYESGKKPLVSADEADSQAVLMELEEAQEIRLNKKVLSLNDVFEVSADGEQIGEIRGEYIYVLGDTFSLFSEEGNLVGSEGEGFRLTTSNAKLFDWENNPTGEWKENISWPMKKWTLYDTEGEKIAQAKQNLSLALKFTIEDMNNEPQFQVEKSLLSVGSRITITKLAENPTMEAIDALWLAAITNEIDEKEKE